MGKVKERKHFTSKDWHLVLTCEWGECNVTCQTMTSFIGHVKTHIVDVGARISSGIERTDFVCQWCDCMHHIEGGVLEFTRHLYFHAFHIKLKSIGMSFIVKNKLATCMLDASGRNIIPDLPDRFHCGWKDCEVVCDNPEFYYQHVKEHSEVFPVGKNIPGGCKCMWEGCENTWKSRYKLQDHCRSHTQERIIACPTCGSLFCSSAKFRDHLLKQDESRRTFQCSHCNKCFAHERLLRDHMRKHVNNYKCPFCEMTVSAPSHLKMHIKYRHTDDRGFVCKICSKGFKTERDIERHEKSRHMTTSFVFCPNDDCDFKCKHQFQLSHHVKTVHEGRQAKYACHVCSSEYQRGRTLTVHLMKHHGFRWMPGHRKFKYNLGEDGKYKLQTVRYESYELAQQMQKEGHRKALSGLDSEALKKLETSRQKSTQSKSNSENGNGTQSETGPLDLSATPNRKEEHTASNKSFYSRHGLTQQLTPPNNNDTYNLEMLGDVALNSSDEYASPQKWKERQRLRARKSLEETICVLRNTPKKDRPTASHGSESDVASSQETGTNNPTSARHRQRKVPAVKRSPARKRLKIERISPIEETENVIPKARTADLPTKDSTQSGPVWIPTFTNQSNFQSNQCQLVTEDGHIIYVETNVPSAIVGLSNMMHEGSGIDYEAIPAGAQLIACGSDANNIEGK